MYTVNGMTFNSMDVQMDLGVHVHNPLNMATQVDRVVKVTHGMFAFFTQGIEYES